MKDDLLDYEEFCALVHVKRGTAYSMVSRGQVPHVRIGRRLVRFPRAEIEKWLAARLVLPSVA